MLEVFGEGSENHFLQKRGFSLNYYLNFPMLNARRPLVDYRIPPQSVELTLALYIEALSILQGGAASQLHSPDGRIPLLTIINLDDMVEIG